MNIPTEILTGGGVAISSAVGGLWVWFKKRLDKVETDLEAQRKDNGDLREKNAEMRTKLAIYRVQRSHGDKTKIEDVYDA